MAQKHSRPSPDGRRAVWLTERLWDRAAALPVTEIVLDSIPEFDQNCWFDAKRVPTCRAVADHARRIRAADLAYPIILSSDGGLMDGGHRIAKAWLEGATTIRAVRFQVDPEPDYFVEGDSSGV